MLILDRIFENPIQSGFGSLRTVLRELNLDNL